MTRYDVPRAGRELRALLKNPDDLPRVFGLIEALQGNAPQTLREGFLSSDEGRALLSRKPDLVPMLTDREKLRAMPKGSLAHAYLAFVESENISAEGILTAAKEGSQRVDEDPDTAWLRGRMRDTHDLWHAVLGYQGDVLGELALLCFILSQHWQPGIALVVAGALTKGMAAENLWLLADGYVRGKRAAWFPSQPWEELLPMQLADVRARLKVGPLTAYTPVRSAELRERGIV